MENAVVNDAVTYFSHTHTVHEVIASCIFKIVEQRVCAWSAVIKSILAKLIGLDTLIYKIDLPNAR